MTQKQPICVSCLQAQKVENARLAFDFIMKHQLRECDMTFDELAKFGKERYNSQAKCYYHGDKS